MEKVNVSFEVDKQIKERFIFAKARIQRIGILMIVSSDTLKRQIKPVTYPSVTASSLIDRLGPGHLVAWKDDFSADKVIVRFVFFQDNIVDL